MPNPAELASRAERAANQLRDWLIEGPVQQADGGVAGVVDAVGGCRYVYGEITGYYLHWLAQARSADPQRRRERAARALAWVEANYHEALAPTRLVRDSDDNDWRNAAQFLFDLAMLAGGLTQAARAGLIAPLAKRMNALAGAFDDFVADGQLRACRWMQPLRAPLPRWSTAGGPFLAKAASRALMAEALFPFAPEKKIRPIDAARGARVSCNQRRGVYLALFENLPPPKFEFNSAATDRVLSIIL